MTVSTQQTRNALILAGIFGLIGVGLGALGAHGLRANLLERGTLAAFETGARYHMFHVLAIFAAAVWLHRATGQPAAYVNWAVSLWAMGIVLFSGSLYWLALGGPRWLGPITPIGGVAFLIGWAAVLVAGLKLERADVQPREQPRPPSNQAR
jgi:uncharacterized membrane protein YgdD (TMEM256/DUF423 family)